MGRKISDIYYLFSKDRRDLSRISHPIIFMDGQNLNFFKYQNFVIILYPTMKSQPMIDIFSV